MKSDPLAWSGPHLPDAHAISFRQEPGAASIVKMPRTLSILARSGTANTMLQAAICVGGPFLTNGGLRRRTQLTLDLPPAVMPSRSAPSGARATCVALKFCHVDARG